MNPWKHKGVIEDNRLGLPKDVTTRIVPQLDTHVASLFTLYHQYQKHHWLVEGPQFVELHHALQRWYEQVHDEFDDIAERITVLGGIPTCSPAEQAKLSYVAHEDEGAFRIRAMLELDRRHEGEIAQKLRHTIALCDKLGDFATEHLLKKILFAVESRVHELDHTLGADSLEIGLGVEEAMAGRRGGQERREPQEPFLE